MELEKNTNFVLFILFISFSQYKFCNTVSYPNICIFIMQLSLIITACPFCKIELSTICYATHFIFCLGWTEEKKTQLCLSTNFNSTLKPYHQGKWQGQGNNFYISIFNISFQLPFFQNCKCLSVSITACLTQPLLSYYKANTKKAAFRQVSVS